MDRPPSEGQTLAMYSDASYFTNPSFGSPETGGYHGYKDYLGDRDNMDEKFQRVLSHVERHVEPGRLLDVGAGPGFLIAAARERGWEALGLDLNSWAARHAREQLGVEVRVQSLQEASCEDESFDAVTMLDMIEHVPDPEGLVREAARIVRPAGVLALLTPDAGSPVSRLMGVRWPEVQRAPEHMTLFSVAGLAEMLPRHGFRIAGWHSIGKTSSLRILAADVAPLAPAIGRPLQRVVQRMPGGRRTVEFDPRTKLALYAIREAHPRGGRPPGGPAGRRAVRTLRVPKEASTDAHRTVAEDLGKLARARRLGDWMFAQFEEYVSASVVEVGPGIGTFSERVLGAGAASLLLVEPEPSSAEVLEDLFAGDERVRVIREQLPEAPTLAAQQGRHDFILCQNVLEHIDDDAAAVKAMGAALRPGGRMTLLVPAHPRLYNSLDRAYGHHRRYGRERLRHLLEQAGMEVTGLYPFNLLGAPGWLLGGLRSSAGLGAASLAAYDLLVAGWRPIEERVRPPWGLSLVAHARRPE
ncbi:MAG: class I SAM-dependent methyltransferase [Actinomycetota bacterium]|nr:class I SAM-dependent methyltransferase [Actinomycetota bacterium]